MTNPESVGGTRLGIQSTVPTLDLDAEIRASKQHLISPNL
jgi:hypothetical protein